MPKEAGFELIRTRGSHEIWKNRSTGRARAVSNSAKSRRTANEALKQAGLKKLSDPSAILHNRRIRIYSDVFQPVTLPRLQTAGHDDAFRPSRFGRGLSEVVS